MATRCKVPGRVARPFGFALTDPSMRLFRTRFFPKVLSAPGVFQATEPSPFDHPVDAHTFGSPRGKHAAQAPRPETWPEDRRRNPERRNDSPPPASEANDRDGRRRAIGDPATSASPRCQQGATHTVADLPSRRRVAGRRQWCRSCLATTAPKRQADDVVPLPAERGRQAVNRRALYLRAIPVKVGTTSENELAGHSAQPSQITPDAADGENNVSPASASTPAQPVRSSRRGLAPAL